MITLFNDPLPYPQIWEYPPPCQGWNVQRNAPSPGLGTCCHYLHKHHPYKQCVHHFSPGESTTWSLINRMQQPNLRVESNNRAINRVCLPKMAGYWPSSFCAFLNWAINHTKEQLQYPTFLTNKAWEIKDLLWGIKKSLILQGTASKISQIILPK